MNTYDSIIPLFLSTDGLCSAMMKPHLEERFVIASNGHLLIKIPTEKLSGKYEAINKYPNWKTVFPPKENYLAKQKTLSVESLNNALNEIPMEFKTETRPDCDGTDTEKMIIAA